MPIPTPAIPPAVISPALYSRAEEAVALEKTRLQIFQYIRIDLPQFLARFERNVETKDVILARLENSVHLPLKRMRRPSITHIIDWAKTTKNVDVARRAYAAVNTVNDRMDFFEEALEDLAKKRKTGATNDDITNTVTYLIDNVQPLIAAERELEQIDELILGSSLAA